MARVTVEDSLEKIPNRFDLVLVASKRARDLAMTGEDPKVAWDNDKSTVVALREIAAGLIDRSVLDTPSQIMIARSMSFGADAAGRPIIENDDFIELDDDVTGETFTATTHSTFDASSLVKAFAALDKQAAADNNTADEDEEV